jgi:hypothetical protein
MLAEIWAGVQHALTLTNIVSNVLMAILGLVCHRIVGVLVEKFGAKISGELSFLAMMESERPLLRVRLGRPLVRLGRWLQ